MNTDAKMRLNGLRLYIVAALLISAAGALILALATQATAAPPAQAPDEGARLFQQKCTSCHTIGKGALVGPDLAGVTERRDPAWLQKWIAGPDKVLAERDPIATGLLQEYRNIPMPNLGLTNSDVTSLIAYLKAAGGGAPAAGGGAAPGALPAGDAAAGKSLFTGSNRFLNGGPPCMACHSVGGIGALGGGRLGPDLTGAFNKYGGASGLDAFIAGAPTATMNAVWSRQPLTSQERASVVAFLQQATVGQRPLQAVWQLAGLAAGGVLVLLAVAAIVWRRRLSRVRRPMVARATKQSV